MIIKHINWGIIKGTFEGIIEGTIEGTITHATHIPTIHHHKPSTTICNHLSTLD